MPARAQRPDATEHDPYYLGYISRTPDGDLVQTLRTQIVDVERVFRHLPEERAAYTYAAGKWTLREVLGHLIDAERVFSYRAAHFSRGDTAPLPSFDQDAWLPAGDYERRPMTDVLDEWVAVRHATVAFAEALPEAGWTRRGVASERPFSVRSALWIIPGHVAYHLEHIERVYR